MQLRLCPRMYQVIGGRIPKKCIVNVRRFSCRYHSNISTGKLRNSPPSGNPVRLPNQAKNLSSLATSLSTMLVIVTHHHHTFALAFGALPTHPINIYNPPLTVADWTFSLVLTLHHVRPRLPYQCIYLDNRAARQQLAHQTAYHPSNCACTQVHT